MPQHHRRLRGDPKLRRLRGVGLFADCSSTEIARLSMLLDEAHLEPGHVLMREGEPGREVFVIVEGHALVSLRGSPLALLGPGEVVGEMAPLDQQPRSATVIAQTPLRVLVAGVLEFAALIDASPSVRRKVLGLVSERLRHVEHPQDVGRAS
jgi:CRP-like cAMP-binding protein